MYSSVKVRVASSMLEKEIKDDRRRGGGDRLEGVCAMRRRAVAAVERRAEVEAEAVA